MSVFPLIPKFISRKRTYHDGNVGSVLFPSRPFPEFDGCLYPVSAH